MTTKTATNNLVDRRYSHGFESIYAFETIDTSSIRVMSATPSPAVTQSIESLALSRHDAEFSFVKSSITPFFLKESIEILKLSSHAERFLRSLGHELIQDLLTLDFNDMTFLRGLGQGHIEEIRTKLKAFIKGRPIEHSTSVDYLSWARSLFRGMDKRVVGVAFEKFGLVDHLPLTTSERIEIKKLPQERKQEWFYQFKETCRTHHDAFDDHLKTIFEAFVKPWMLGRGGFASSEELRELAWRLGEDCHESQSVLALFSELFCDGAHPFFRMKESSISGVYVAHAPAERLLRCITKVLSTYFYESDVVYELEVLADWVEREFACAWIDLNREHLKRAIRLIDDYQTLLVKQGIHVKEIVRID